MQAPVDLNLLRAFVAVHNEKSFAIAATKLGLPRSTLSRAVLTLEESLGVTLFQRTTRKVASTSAGDALFDRVATSVASLDASFSDLPDARAEPSGTLRLTATADFGAMVLAEAVARYTQRYPRVRVEARLTTDLLDLVKDNVDVAVRFARRPLRDSTLQARKIGKVAGCIYASPSYLARRGTPRSPSELSAHDWVDFLGRPPLRLYELTKGAERGRGEKITAPTRVSADNLWFMREAIKSGAGIGELPSFIADPDVTTGDLVHVLPRWVALSGTIYLIHPSSKHTAPRVAAFRDLLVEMLRQRPIGQAVG